MQGTISRWKRAGQASHPGMVALAIGVVVAAALPAAGRAADPIQVAAPIQVAPLTSGEFEARYGIRLDQIAVTGGGGLVDVRFTVLDPARAKPLLRGHEGLPRVLVEGGGAALEAPSHGAMRNIRLQRDAACFLLYPNARGAIRPGTRVALAFGDVRLEQVVVK
jgi:hypothetical protein